MGTTSKTLAPALRLGWLIVPDSLTAELAHLKALVDNFSPTLEQLAMAHMLERGTTNATSAKRARSTAAAATGWWPRSQSSSPS